MTKRLLPRVGFFCLIALLIEAATVSFRVIEFTQTIAILNTVLASICAIALFLQLKVTARAHKKIAAHERYIRMVVDQAHRFVVSRIVELRRPLQGLVGIQDLFSSDRTAQSAAEYFDIADFCSRYLIRQLERIQNFSELGRRTLRFERADVSLKSIVSGAIMMAGEQADTAKNAQIVEDWSPELPEKLNMHGQALKQILVELLDNAIRYGGDGQIHLRVMPDPHNVKLFCIHISDAGPGLSDRQVEALRKTPRIEKKHAAWATGREGLGHVLAKNIAQQIGATIGVDSRRGVGTSFTVTFAADSVSLSALLEESSRNRKHAIPLKVLVVDDEVVTRHVVSAIVTSFGYEVDTATNGQEAVAMVQRDYYDLIFMDLEMPIMDGLTASRVILNDLHLIKPPYIAVLTSHCTQEDRDKIQAAGISHFLPKPAGREEIRRAIDKAHEKMAEDIELAREAAEYVAGGDQKPVEVDDLGERNAIEPGYLINFNKLYSSLGENLSMCRQILFNAGETLAHDCDLLARAVRERDFGQAKNILHKLRGESSMIMCEPLVLAIKRMQEAVKSKDEAGMLSRYNHMKIVTEQVLAEIEGLNKPNLQAA